MSQSAEKTLLQILEKLNSFLNPFGRVKVSVEEIANGNNNLGNVHVSGISAGNTNIGDVDVASIAAGETHVGAIGGHTSCIDVTPVLSVHATYATGDYVGTTGVAMTFANAARVNNGTGIIIGALLVDGALQSVSGELWLFDNTVTPPADSAAWTLTDAEMKSCIGIVPFQTYYASAANSVSPAGNLTIAFQTAVGSKALYGCFVTRGAPAYASGDLTFRLRVLQD